MLANGVTCTEPSPARKPISARPDTPSELKSAVVVPVSGLGPPIATERLSVLLNRSYDTEPWIYGPAIAPNEA